MKLPILSSIGHNTPFRPFFAQYRWIEKLLIAIFCLVLPLGVRVTLWEFGQHHPYTTVFLYATDAIMAMILAWWFFAKKTHIKQLLRQTLHDGDTLLPVLVFFALFGIGSISALRSDLPPLGVASVARLALFALFVFILAIQKPSALHASSFTFPIFLSGVFQALLGIYQFIGQRQSGLALLGEQALGSGIAGIAKIDVLGEKIVRAYGTLPHPNVLAAFLIFAIFVSAGAYMSAHADAAKPRNVQRAAMWQTGIMLMLVALLFTFSRGGWLAFGLGGAIFLLWLIMRRSVLSPDQKQRLAALGIVAAGAALFAGLYFRDAVQSRAAIPELQDQAVQMRLNGIYQAAQMIDANRYTGVGPGQFTEHIDKHAGPLPEPWMYQPVHSVYALVAAEFGILGFAAYLLLLWAVGRLLFASRKHLHTPHAAAAAAIFCAVFVLGFFDHYFFTFEQGMGIFWMSLALASSLRKLAGA